MPFILPKNCTNNSAKYCKSNQSLWRRAYARNISLKTLYSRQFTLSTQLIIPNYLVILSHRRSKLNLLHLSVGTGAMIGQFRGLYFTVRPAKFKSLFELKFPPFIWTQIYNKYLPKLIFLVLTNLVFFFARICGPRALPKIPLSSSTKKWATWVNFGSVIAFFF